MGLKKLISLIQNSGFAIVKTEAVERNIKYC